MKYCLSLTVAMLLATNVSANQNQFSVKDLFSGLFDKKTALSQKSQKKRKIQLYLQLDEEMEKVNSEGAYKEIDLLNLNNEQYVGSLWVGDSKQKIPIMFDTGSPMVYFLTDSCDKGQCPQETKFSLS